LKLKELSYLHAEGYPGGELKHGPLALIEPGVVVVAVVTDPAMHEKMLSNLAEVKARGATVVAVATDDDELIAAVADYVLRVPATEPMFTPWSTSSAAALRLRHGPGPRPQRRPAAQPRQDRDGRVVATWGSASTSSTCPLRARPRRRPADRRHGSSPRVERSDARKSRTPGRALRGEGGGHEDPERRRRRGAVEVDRGPPRAQRRAVGGAARPRRPNWPLERGVDELHVSLTHTAMTAAAFVVASRSTCLAEGSAVRRARRSPPRPSRTT
jgi:hypothetical protein